MLSPNHSFRYLPFTSGHYSTAPGLKLTDNESRPEDKLIFQLDGQYHHYLRNKQACRGEGIGKYYIEADLPAATIRAINNYILDQLLREHPAYFARSQTVLFNHLKEEEIPIPADGIGTADAGYLSLFDALSNQVQEDLAVFQLTRLTDYLAAIHLCAPNHWSPAEKVGQPFDAIHQPVAGMEQTITNYRKILESIVRKRGSFTRFAWGIGTDDRLNHHPEPPSGVDSETWSGRSPTDQQSPVFARVERQNLIGFPEENAFLFTIRTYFYDIETLSPDEKQKLWQAVQGMSLESLAYKGLSDWKTELGNRLNQNP